MVFRDGFFHADPHPGNLFVEPGGRIALIDFGMVGDIDEQLRERLGTLLLALVRQNPRRIAAALSDQTGWSHRTSLVFFPPARAPIAGAACSRPTVRTPPP